jgi:hypothetical protein
MTTAEADFNRASVEVLVITAKSLREQADAIDKAIKVLQELPAEVPTETRDMLFKFTMNGVIGALEVLKSFLVTRHHMMECTKLSSRLVKSVIVDAEFDAGLVAAAVEKMGRDK